MATGVWVGTFPWADIIPVWKKIFPKGIYSKTFPPVEASRLQRAQVEQLFQNVRNLETPSDGSPGKPFRFRRCLDSKQNLVQCLYKGHPLPPNETSTSPPKPKQPPSSADPSDQTHQSTMPAPRSKQPAKRSTPTPRLPTTNSEEEADEDGSDFEDGSSSDSGTTSEDADEEETGQDNSKTTASQKKAKEQSKRGKAPESDAEDLTEFLQQINNTSDEDGLLDEEGCWYDETLSQRRYEKGLSASLQKSSSSSTLPPAQPPIPAALLPSASSAPMQRPPPHPRPSRSLKALAPRDVSEEKRFNFLTKVDSSSQYLEILQALKKKVQIFIFIFR